MTKVLLYTAVLMTAAWAQESSQTPKQETLQQAIQFEKYKIAAAEAQARKDAAESGAATQTTRKSASKARKARSEGQADKAKSDTTKR
jgi:hypothetical protein